MNKIKHTQIVIHSIMKMFITLFTIGILLSSCKDNDIEPNNNEENPSFTMNLDFAGGLDTSLEGEEISPIELDKTEKELRSAGINLKRDPASRNFKVELDLSKSSELPVVVALRLINGGTKRMFLGKTTMTLLKENGSSNRKFRIEKKGVQFYELDNNGAKRGSQISNLPDANGSAYYEAKIFVSANLEDKDTNSGKKYLVNYGFDKNTNESELKPMNDDGSISFNGVQGKIPFVSSWSRVLFSRNGNETGVSNDNSAKLINIKPEGSILMLKISNKMEESTLDLQSVRVYSEALTANLAYIYDAAKADFTSRPASSIKTFSFEDERYLNAAYERNITLQKLKGSKTFFFWAKSLSKDYLQGKDWIQTSVVAKVMETQKNGQRYWFNVPLLKLYSPLSKVHDGKVVRTELNLEDGTPIHPMNLFAHRFVWHVDGNYTSTNYSAQWRGGNNYYMSALYDGYTSGLISGISSSGWDESYYIHFGPENTKNWYNTDKIRLPFGKIKHVNPMTFENPNDLSDLNWSTPSLRQLAALFPIGSTSYWVDQTNKETDIAILQEQAKMEAYQEDTDFYTILKRKQNRTFAIRFLRKTADGMYYMTPYTAAYRYDAKSIWEEKGKYINSSDNKLSTLEIRMRPLGGTTNQYNDADANQGYYSPKFTEEQLKKLFSIVLEEGNASVLDHHFWWQHSPLKEDDVVREYPALGSWKGKRTPLYHVGARLNISTHNGTKHDIFSYGKTNNYKFDWYSNGDYAPIVLLAKRKIIQK